MLTPPEQRGLALVAEGKTNKNIAAQMELRPDTVKNYISNMFAKLKISWLTQRPRFTLKSSYRECRLYPSLHSSHSQVC